jgi:hypothetical protein
VIACCAQLRIDEAEAAHADESAARAVLEGTVASLESERAARPAIAAAAAASISEESAFVAEGGRSVPELEAEVFELREQCITTEVAHSAMPCASQSTSQSTACAGRTLWCRKLRFPRLCHSARAPKLLGLGFGSITGVPHCVQNSNRHKNDMIEAFRHKLMGNEEELTRLRRSPSLSPHSPPRCGYWLLHRCRQRYSSSHSLPCQIGCMRGKATAGSSSS